ncbi:DEAD/DEAH box helicase [Tepidibacillus infernus]|uniref:ATP-dependent RNA helicase CshA n=1 Tax=Tepidibacillus decaturensis TaxID=1413211 RepID=A0A135L3I3_9BACI|nr:MULTISPECIES: DEAD/DEAH box helicase [Tepidibacillus]KXG43457.1 RNA helicase [Tepidibacillus decaturensis]GBF11321.1 DEAD-box ATP-dependent RNA helicase CshA [Tepidibacillus sp. HK-1]
MNQFSQLSLQQDINRAIHEMGFEEPSPIQQACIPVILKGKDVIGHAQTGTGKTAAFGIPIVQLVTKQPKVQSIVLTPTRELAIQVSEELRKIAKYKRLKVLPIYGGQSIGHQIRALKQGVHIVIGTPGRVLDHIRKNTLQLQDVKMFVLDEADEMLDMGFIDDIEEIIRKTPNDRQTLLFSATMPYEIKKLANRYLKNPEVISMNRGEVTAPSIEQVYYKVLENNKLDSLCRIIDHHEVDLGIIFCRTKKTVDELTESLLARGYIVDGLHGDLSQNQRDKVMKRFREKTIEFLIATDVAARGIDVGNVSHVINYDIPQDPESYVHRIGRTGRAGKTGIAITLVTPREIKLLKTIEQEVKNKITPQELPTIEELKLIQQKQWKKQLIDIIENNQEKLADFNLLLDELAQQYDWKEIVSAAFNLAFVDKFLSQSVQDEYDFGETGARPGMVRFFMNIGRNVELTPKEIVHMISEEVDIPAQSIGKINIFEKFSFIEVPEEVAPFVYEALRYSRVNGYRIVLEPARPKSQKV